jgi:thiosulfate dehydrogenase
MNMESELKQQKKNSKMKRSVLLFFPVTIVCSVILLQTISCSPENKSGHSDSDTTTISIADLFLEEKVWTAPDTSTIPKGEEGKLIRYGLELIIHTSKYFGPKGSLSLSTNGLNCQNCHMEAGTRPYGNNLGSASATYPVYLPRSGSVVSIAEKVNECFLRSLNGNPIDTNSREMLAFAAYLKWLGKDYRKEDKLAGTNGIEPPRFIDRAADPLAGQDLYDTYCARCHGKDGEGQLAVDVLKDESKQQGGTATKEDWFYYPPVWGDKSYNGIATLYRISKLAGFLKNNMPYPVTYKSPVLTDEQAWDIAAYINSRQRPIKDHSKDYIADISKKPYDFPFGPYADSFSEEQHKFGPYKAMPSLKIKH